MEQQEIVERLRTVMQRCTDHNVDWDTVDTSTHIQTLGFDSLSVLDLIYEIQQEFSVEVEAEAFVSVKTVADVVALLTRCSV